MGCPDENTMGAYIEGLLSVEHIAVVDGHVDRCEECRHLLAALAADLSLPSSHDREGAPDPTTESMGVTSGLGSTSARGDVSDAWHRLALSAIDRFELVRPLGAGGMGAVYEVIDRDSGAHVALKTLRALKTLSPHALYRFKREFRALAGTRHPNLVTLYELVHEADLWFFTMELIQGVDLLTWVDADRKRLRPALLQLCEGLTALHAAGAVHRDIKPANVMVTPQGRVVVLDFGLVARIDDGGESAGAGIAGTVIYMSPEQAAEQPATPASDWYAVGTMLYQALTGQLPYVGPALEVLADKQTCDPAPPAETNPSVEPTLGQLCLELLHRDPSLRPSGSEIVARLAEREPGQTVPVAATRSRICEPHRFVGRQRELAELRDAFGGVLARESPGLAHVSGASGIGKTALIECFLAEIEAGDPRPWLLRGRCHERESVPYKAFDALVDELTRHLRTLDADELMFVLPAEVRRLAAIFPVLNRVRAIEAPRFGVAPIAEPSQRQRRAFEALRDLLRNLARLRPVVLSFDDLQWADGDSLELLKVLVGSPEMGPLLLLLGYRDENEERLAELREITENVPGNARVAGIRLGPLSDQESAKLTAMLLDDDGADGPAARSVVAAAGGNPFFVRELVHLLRGQPDRGAPDSASALGLDAVIVERLGRLPEQARSLLTLASVAGEAIPKEMLRAATGRSKTSADWREGMSTLRTQCLLREHGPREVDAVEVYHDKIRERVLAGLSAESLVAHHRRLAVAVERVKGDDVDRLARHWRASGDLERALRYVTRAAEVATDKLAFDRAALLYRAALDMIDDREGHVDLGRALGEALSNLGRLGEAGAAYNDAADCADAGTRLILRQMAAMQWLTGGYLPQGLAAIRDVLSELGVRLPQGPGQALRSLLYRRAKLAFRGLGFRERAPEAIPAPTRARLDALFTVGEGLFSVNLVLAVDFQTRFTLEALRSGDLRHVALALSREAMGRVATSSRQQERSLGLLDQAEALSRRGGDVRTLASILLARGAISFYGGQWQACIDAQRRVEDDYLSRCHGAQHLRSSARWFRCFALSRQGCFEALAERVPLYLAEADRAGDRFGAGILRTTCNITWLAADDPGRARAELAGVLDTFPEGSYLAQHFAHAAAIWDQLVYQGDGAAACEAARGELAQLKRSQLFRNSLVRGMFHLGLGRATLLAAASCDDRTGKRRWLDRARRHANALQREGLRHTSAWGELLDAGVQCQLGELDRHQIVALLDGAIARLEVADCRAVAAAAKQKRGELDGGQQGLQLIAEADAWLTAQHVKNPARFASFLAPGFVTG